MNNYEYHLNKKNLRRNADRLCFIKDIRFFFQEILHNCNVYLLTLLASRHWRIPTRPTYGSCILRFTIITPVFPFFSISVINSFVSYTKTNVWRLHRPIGFNVHYCINNGFMFYWLYTKEIQEKSCHVHAQIQRF